MFLWGSRNHFCSTEENRKWVSKISLSHSLSLSLSFSKYPWAKDWKFMTLSDTLSLSQTLFFLSLCSSPKWPSQTGVLEHELLLTDLLVSTVESIQWKTYAPNGYFLISTLKYKSSLFGFFFLFFLFFFVYRDEILINGPSWCLYRLETGNDTMWAQPTEQKLGLK